MNDDCWESICERLGIDPEPAPEPVPAKKPAQIKRWIWAAAAGILALVGVFVAYQWGDEEVVAEAEKVSNAVPKEPVLSKIQEESVVEEKPSYQLMAVKTHKQNQGNRPLIHANSSLIQALPQHQTTCPPDSAEAETSQSDRNLEENSRDSVRQNHDVVPMITELYPEPTPVPAKKQLANGLLASMPLEDYWLRTTLFTLTGCIIKPIKLACWMEYIIILTMIIIMILLPK